ncbi:CinA family protein [Nocardia donostiensis]|uniref:Competence protein n=1 Tax=Nocardia donostiensis TaxID=1538463 RepID=A0A1W0BJC6_9NOCA|nr:CinA family protein [Nocardia donostiensis]ONM47789.1 competence protein [Nocardia donostiensis]OQS13720.1 competence protein [Nocardia donostiensis]OQS22541.1 competence protein [Nocardia donostiensis]
MTSDPHDAPSPPRSPQSPTNSDPLTAATAAGALVGALTTAEQTVATAESLTAGLLTATIAGIPGASLVLRGGLVVYATDLKNTLAGVSADLLAVEGPVAAGTAEQLAVGARTRCGADWGIGLTGVAGPDPQGGHSPGTVFLGLAGSGHTEVMRLKLAGDRWNIRFGATQVAVQELLRCVRAAAETG